MTSSVFDARHDTPDRSEVKTEGWSARLRRRRTLREPRRNAAFNWVFEHDSVTWLAISSPASASQGLNAPYDAKRIGDYTGLTPPFDDEDE
jgi:hypothetical protein